MNALPDFKRSILEILQHKFVKPIASWENSQLFISLGSVCKTHPKYALLRVEDRVTGKESQDKKHTKYTINSIFFLDNLF